MDVHPSKNGINRYWFIAKSDFGRDQLFSHSRWLQQVPSWGSVSLHPCQQKTRLVKFDPQRNCATWESIRNHGQIWTVSPCQQLFIDIISLIEDHYSDLQMDTNGAATPIMVTMVINSGIRRNPQQDWKECTSSHGMCHSSIDSQE